MGVALPAGVVLLGAALLLCAYIVAQNATKGIINASKAIDEKFSEDAPKAKEECPEKAAQDQSPDQSQTEKPPALPKNPDDLTKRGYKETSNPEAAKAGHRTFENPETGDKVRFDKGKPGAPGWEGEDHYHRYNPDATGKNDEYLDTDGNPVPRGSDASHLEPSN